MGILPDQNKKSLMKNLAVLKKYLETKTSLKIEFVIPNSYQELIEIFIKKEIDFAKFGALTYLQANEKVPTLPLFMRKNDKEFHTYIITKRESLINSLEEIRGKTFTFGSRSSTSGHLMPRYFLNKNNIDPEFDFKGKPVFSGSHEMTAKLVFEGKIEVGAINASIYQSYLKNGKYNYENLKIIWTTPPYTDYTWVVRKDFNKNTSNIIKEAFLDLLPGNPDHRKILDSQNATYYIEAKEEDFEKTKAVAKKMGFLRE